SSVDAERAFSGGRLQVLRSSSASNKFKARVALGSWIGTPLMPTSDVAVKIL
ncbi:hypothetical protein B0H14DRAFT_2224941, partial [Mycena olivaceomarginata]